MTRFALALCMAATAGCIKPPAPLLPWFAAPQAPVEVVAAGPHPGQPAPEIVGEDLDGVPFRLSDYRGKVVVLDFWGHW
jgi:hypothetical protein